MSTKIKGVFMVALGGISYGVLAVFVKIAYGQGYTTAEISSAQYTLGFFVILLLNVINVKKKKQAPVTGKDRRRLMLAGTSMGFTSIFYYLSVKYIPVSICIVLLMQCVWIGLILEAFQTRRLPGARKTVAAVLVLGGTLLATNVFEADVALDWRGVTFGFLSAVTYTITIWASNHIAVQLKPMQRSLYLLAGGMLIIVLVWLPVAYNNYNWSVIWRWGIMLCLFSTIIPPLLFTRWMPVIGVGLGSIVASVEIPVSVLFAYFLLNEKIAAWQWLGIAIILVAIVIMNTSFGKLRAQLNK